MLITGANQFKFINRQRQMHDVITILPVTQEPFVPELVHKCSNWVHWCTLHFCSSLSSDPFDDRQLNQNIPQDFIFNRGFEYSFINPAHCTQIKLNSMVFEVNFCVVFALRLVKCHWLLHKMPDILTTRAMIDLC